MTSMRLALLRYINLALPCLIVAGLQFGCNPFTQEYYKQELQGPMGSRYNDQIFPATSDAGKKIIHAWQEYNLIVDYHLENQPKPDYVMMQGAEHLYFYYPTERLVVHFRKLPMETTKTFRKTMDSGLQQKLLGAMR